MNRSITFAISAMSASCLVLAAGASADVVQRVFWNPRLNHNGSNDPFIGQSTDETLALAGNLTASGYTRYGSNGTIGFGNVPVAFDESFYIEFSLIPGSGQKLDVHDLILQGEAALAGQGVPLDRIVLRTELDGFTSDIAAVAGPSNLRGNTGLPVAFDLEHLPELRRETAFRLYVWNTAGNFGIVGSIATRGFGMWFGNIDASAVPAPAAGAAAALAAFGAAQRRRR